MNQKIIIEPIGYLHSELIYRYETPRQGVLAGGKISFIELNPNCNFEQAVKDLDGFERLWILYQFHLNNNWKPLVNPPRHTRKKVGVFASRAPYRPNQIGMSCVKLEKVDGLKIFISESDILDGSPVIDIKPYLPYSDSFPLAATGWVKNGIENIYEVYYQPQAVVQCNWLKEIANINLIDFARLQLEFNPTDSTRKRISEAENGRYILAYRTWRIIYTVDEIAMTVTIREIRTGYDKEELLDIDHDKYHDKPLHQKFENQFHK
ncbi:MAG: tRNA (N6-threonylcarbamoyladenosine(37)-N6)-methyltransferase TrmO [Ignavibacteriales bacterium]|nr:tRNA (N6-threonylcarbamoyladenosine(37)-N6)-methyltransferase TrmO [Ignavibacteriales bacterium]